MADLKTQFGFTDSLFDAINEVKKASGTSLAGADAQIKRAKANLDAAELRASHEKEREKVQKKKESLRTEEVEETSEKFDPLKHVKNPTSGEKKAAKDVKRSSYADRAAMLKSAQAGGRLKEEEEVEEESHQSKTTMKHINNPNAAEKKAAKDIKPGIKGVKDRLDMLKAAKARGALKEEELEESFSPSQIAALKKEYSKINGIDPSSDNYKKLIAMLDKLDLASLKSLAGADIKFVSSLAKNRVMRKSMKKEEVEIEEGTGDLKPGWMLKKDPELAKKVKEKQDLAKKREASYGDKSAGKSVAEGIMDKIKAVKRGMDAKAKADDHFDKAGDPKNPNKSKDLKRAVKYHNLVNKEETEIEEELSPAQKAIDKNKNGKIDGTDLAHLRSKKKQPQGAEFAAARRKERMASNGRMDEEVKVGDKVSFDHEMKAIPGKTMKKIGTVHKVEDGTVHIKVKDKYGVITHKKSASELTKEEFESIDEAPKYDNKYTIYHKDYSSAVQHAAVHAGKQGYEIDHDDWDRVVAMGPKKPSAGKTNILNVSLKKDGKESKKKLHMQVYNMDNKGYELNTYVEEMEQGVAEGLIKDIKRLATGKDVKSRAGQEIAKSQDASMKGDTKTSKKHFGRFDKLDKLANKEQGVAEEVQELDELNKDTVYSYAKKSEKDQDDQEKKMDKAFKANDPKKANDAGRKFLNRLKGSERAEKRLNKEEVELDEAAKQPTKRFKDMKKKNTAGTKSEEGASKKGEPLSGKKEAIEVNPELHKNQK
jgi:hypothetical protein